MGTPEVEFSFLERTAGRCEGLKFYRKMESWAGRGTEKNATVGEILLEPFGVIGTNVVFLFGAGWEGISTMSRLLSGKTRTKVENIVNKT